MFRSILTAAFVLAVPLLCLGELIDTAGSAPGSYVLTIGDDGKVVSIVGPTRLTLLRDASSSPTNPTDPAPQPETPFEVNIRDLTAETLVPTGKGTKQTGAGLSAVYAIASGAVAKGELPGNKIEEFIAAASDKVLEGAAADDRTAWNAWRLKITGIIGRLSGQGELATREQWADLLSQINRGVDAATGVPVDPAKLSLPGAAQTLPALADIDWVKLITLILELFKLLREVRP